MGKDSINIGVIGWGTVGSGVVKILLNQPEYIMNHKVLSLNLRRIADLNITTPRDTKVDPSLLTTNVLDIINDPEIDIVVETIGGLKPASDFIFSALKAGKHVVTANKAVLAVHAKELFKTAREHQAKIGFEASVGGCIPIIRALREGLAGNRAQAIYGIVNGTCNYILSQMTNKGVNFDIALKDAQKRGYAEAKPEFDIEGIDAANKIAILASLAFERDIKVNNVFTEGITDITQNDIQYAKEFGYRIKLLAIAKLGDDKVQVRVHPTMLPERSMLANVEGVFNAIYIVGNATGSTMFYGRGAGQMPAASAVVSDIIDIAKTIISGAESQKIPVPVLNSDGDFLKPIEECKNRYYIRLQALDQPGVLAKVAGILGQNGISIASVIQMEGRGEKGTVPVVMMTHEAIEKNVQAALHEIDALLVITPKSMLIRVETMEGEEENLAIV